MSDVFFQPFSESSLNNSSENRISLEPLLSRFSGMFDTGETDLFAIKIHPGEHGNRYFLKPDKILCVIKALGLRDDRIFLTDTTVLYGGRRMSAPQYTILAREHGFGAPDTPPFLVADGLRGIDDISVPLPSSCKLDVARIARMIFEADGLVVISHFKGHMLAGFGGAIKNLAMGCASRAGKLVQHSSVKPVLNKDKCTKCGACIENCPASALTMGNTAELNSSICTGCGECLMRCPTGALRVNWNQESGVFHSRLAEYAYGVVSCRKRPVLYINFICDVSACCDCDPQATSPMIDDIGVLASTDPVAIDQVCYDLVRDADVPETSHIYGKAGKGDDKFLAVWPAVNSQLQLERAQIIGLGNRTYNFIEV